MLTLVVNHDYKKIELRQDLEIKLWFKKKKLKFSRFPIFLFCAVCLIIYKSI